MGSPWNMAAHRNRPVHVTPSTYDRVMSTTDTGARRTVEAVWRGEAASIVAALTRHTGDFAWSEDLAQEALLEALTRWPRSGVPDRPGAWLLTVAKRRAADGWRRSERLSHREPLLAVDVEGATDAVDDLADPDRIDDDVLRLVFVACHPVLMPQARLALTLRTVAGLTTEQIARMLLVKVQAVQQRIVRAKRTLADAEVAFEVPDRTERPARMASVLQVTYLLFTEGYTGGTGEKPLRPQAAHEAIRLVRQLAFLLPTEPEVHALNALMEFQVSRFAARIDSDGLPVALAQQDRRLWDHSAISRGRVALGRIASPPRGYGYYRLQAEIAACHCATTSYEDTDWDRIVRLYDALAALADSPIVRLNRAVAVSMRDGAAEALPLLSQIEKPLSGFRGWHAVKAELLERLGETEAAAAEFREAAALPGSTVEAAALRRRADTARGTGRADQPKP